MKARMIKTVNEPIKMKAKKINRFKKTLKFMKYALMTAIFAATAAYAALSPLFNITRITAVKSAHYDQDALIGASGLRTGMNGFRLVFGGKGKFLLFRIGTAEKAIMDKCPYVKNACVRYIFPSAVAIEVEEREACAVLGIEGMDLLIDREGYLLEIHQDPGETNLPVIRGIEPESVVPGGKLNINEEILLSAFKVFDTIKEVDEMDQDKLMPDVDYVDVADLRNVRLSLQSRVIVNLGGMDDLHYKISAAKAIFAGNIKKTERGALDFSSGGNPVFSPENGG